MTASTKERIKWMLKILTEKASSLSEHDLEWTIRMESAFKDYGNLSPRQLSVLEGIYDKYKLV